MNVELMNYTADAMDLLLRTKNTRLKFDQDPANWSQEEKEQHIAYMRDTIASSWEFVNYTFRITGVTRAFTHQLVRTRTGSYAQESQRTIDASLNNVVKPDRINNDHRANFVWNQAVKDLMESYSRLLELGIPAQDARGLLPTNIETSIIAQFNLRTLSGMMEKRLCPRTQGEYQDVAREMRRLVIEAHPWAADFLDVHCAVHGTCAFPRWGVKECKIYPETVGNDKQFAIRDKVRKVIEIVRQEAVPIAVGAKTM